MPLGRQGLKALGWKWDGGGVEAWEYLSEEPGVDSRDGLPTTRGYLQIGGLDLLGS